MPICGKSQVKRAMIRAVNQINVLLDSSKFGQRAFSSFATLAEVDRLFTDEGISAEYQAACRQLGVQLSIV